MIIYTGVYLTFYAFRMAFELKKVIQETASSLKSKQRSQKNEHKS